MANKATIRDILPEDKLEQTLNVLLLERRWFGVARAVERLSANADGMLKLYTKGLLVRYNAGEKSLGLLKEMEEVVNRNE